MIAIAAATNHMGSSLICESINACQSIPLVAFHNNPIDKRTRMVGQARLRMDFHPDWILVLGWACELISIRIMLWAPKVLNLGELLQTTRPLPAGA